MQVPIPGVSAPLVLLRRCAQRIGEWTLALWHYPREHPLGRRLVGWILLCSSVVTLMTTGFELAADYRRDVSQIDARMTEIEHSYLESVAMSAWHMNDEQMQAQMRGILRLPDVVHVVLVDPSGAKIAEAGNARTRFRPIVRRFPIVFTREGSRVERVPLGTLTVTASLEGVVQRLEDKALVILMSQAFKTFVVAICMLLIFQRLVSRPLSLLAREARRLNVDQLSEPIRLPRPRRRGADDELDMLVESLNGMRTSIQREVDELRSTRRALWLSEERYRSLVESTAVVPWEADPKTGDVTFVGPQVETILGIPHERWFEPGFWRTVVHPEDHRALLKALATRRPEVECRLIDGSGRERWMALHAARILSPDGPEMLMGYLLDVDARKRTGLELERHRAQLKELVAQRTAELAANVVELERTIEQLNREMAERQRFENELRHQALHDGLTGLPNRSLLMDRLELAIKLARRNRHSLTLLFIDLDRFKIINDSLGHDAGDLLLKTVTQRVSQIVRTSDTFARLGGDEFVLLLPNAVPEDVLERLVGRIAAAVAEPVLLGEHEVAVTCSIGCSIYPQDGEDAATLLKHADVAMYRAKEQGRNNVQRYRADLQQHAHQTLEIESQLRRAIERNELLLHYQPQLDLATGEIVAVEALIRWRHPEMGMVPPLRFIPIAEECGLIGPIGEWVLRTACLQAVAWREAGLPPLRVSVNLSAQQFLNPALEEQVVATLAETGLGPEGLELELTESTSMKDPEQSIRILDAFRARGIGLAIDDFGTGYSNLGYLRRFPVDRVKLDRSFIKDVLDDANAAAIAEAIIALARKLQLQTVAEGVETQAQRDWLAERGCDAMQGYWFAKPLEPDAVAALLQAHRATKRISG
jgi:diguanylate cyclase (GGDEF)-like protein/PAS domain S-box-containing protein